MLSEHSLLDAFSVNSDYELINWVLEHLPQSTLQFDQLGRYPLHLAWSNSSLQIKESVERSLHPYASRQMMNHCVTNYYRDGNDFIDHHSDKDLDLNKDGVIVSVSLGEERILELRRRAKPKDTTRIFLPHCPMLVLGPRTNKLFTYSILTKDNANGKIILRAS